MGWWNLAKIGFKVFVSIFGPALLVWILNSGFVEELHLLNMICYFAVGKVGLEIRVF